MGRGSVTTRLVCLLLISLLAACGGQSEDEAREPGASPHQTTTTLEDFSHLAKCEDYFGEGVVLRALEAFDLAGCVTAEGDPAFYNSMSEECVDGRTLHWADGAGWGYDGEPWHADAFDPPADELLSCQG